MFIPNKKKYRRPVKINGISFSNLNNLINEFLRADNKEEIKLDGYFETITEYFNVNKDNLPQIHYLMIATNSWSEYIDDCMEYLNYVIYTKELQKDYIKSFLEKLKKGQAKSDEYLNKEKYVAELTKIIIKMKLFSKYLLNQRKFAISISYHCKNLYEAGINNLLYKTPIEEELNNLYK